MCIASTKRQRETRRRARTTDDRTMRVKPTRTLVESVLQLRADILLHGGNILGQAHHVPEARCGCATDDDGPSKRHDSFTQTYSPCQSIARHRPPSPFLLNASFSNGWTDGFPMLTQRRSDVR